MFYAGGRLGLDLVFPTGMMDSYHSYPSRRPAPSDRNLLLSVSKTSESVSLNAAKSKSRRRLQEHPASKTEEKINIVLFTVGKAASSCSY